MSTATILSGTKLARVLTDPVVLHANHEDWVPRDSHNLYEAIGRARLHRLATTPLTERTTHATWPELVTYCSTAAMDARYVGEPMVLVYTKAFREYLDRWTALDPDAQPAPVSDLTAALTETETAVNASADELANALRERIKTEQDRVFADAFPASVCETIPATFWTPDTADDGELDVTWADTALDPDGLAETALTGTMTEIADVIMDAVAAVADADVSKHVVPDLSCERSGEIDEFETYGTTLDTPSDTT